MRPSLLILAITISLGSQIAAQAPKSAAREAAICGDPINASDCKMYIAGFADTVQMAFVLSNPRRSICNDLKNLMYEFIREVKTNPNVRHKDADHVLYDLLTKSSTCGEIEFHEMSAGDFLDICLMGDVGFNLCSEYRAGASNALFLLDEGKYHLLCGNRNLSLNVIPNLREKLEEDYTLRSKPATYVIAQTLSSLMPCGKGNSGANEGRETNRLSR